MNFSPALLHPELLVKSDKQWVSAQRGLPCWGKAPRRLWNAGPWGSHVELWRRLWGWAFEAQLGTLGGESVFTEACGWLGRGFPVVVFCSFLTGPTRIQECQGEEAGFKMNTASSKPHRNPQIWNTPKRWAEGHIYVHWEVERFGFSQKEKRLRYITNVHYIVR